jgi:hypothetical protein
VRFIYALGAEETNLKRFIAESVACRNPFEKYGKEDLEYCSWSNLFRELPDLGLDVARAAAKKSNVFPWDDARISEYMEEELDLNRLWEEQILKRRNLEEIEEDARGGCIRSIIELDHINHNKRLNRDE